MQTSTSVRQESITATPMLSVTTLKALTFVHANQDILETALAAQVNDRKAFLFNKFFRVPLWCMLHL